MQIELRKLFIATRFLIVIVLKLLPDNKVEVSGICAWCNGNGSVDFHSCYTCSGSGWLVFEDEEEVREEQTEIEIKVE